MKKTITTIAAAFLMTLSLSSFATTNLNPLKEKPAKEILVSYVAASSLGAMEFNKFLFTADFEYENTTNGTKYNKKKYLEFLKENKGLTYNCSTSYEILDQTDKTSIAKSTMQFENFTRIDHITMIQTPDGWKVNKVITSYQ